MSESEKSTALLVSQVNCLNEIFLNRADEDLEADHRKVLMLGMDIIEGRDISPAIQEIIEQGGDGIAYNHSTLKKVCIAISSLLWDYAKYAGKSPIIAQNMLIQLGVSENIAVVLVQVLVENRKQILQLAKSLGPSAYSYSNLSWRLEVELGRRGMLATTEPKYALRLDLLDHSKAHPVGQVSPSSGGNQSDSSNSSGSAFSTIRAGGTGSAEQQHHLQCSYATMLLLQTELQKASDELASVHSRRLTKYIS
jgi:hypothetical protein